MTPAHFLHVRNRRNGRADRRLGMLLVLLTTQMLLNGVREFVYSLDR